jgi:hypothetical protein
MKYQKTGGTMFRKGFIWFLVLAFLSVSIAPDYAFGYFDGGFGHDYSDKSGIVIAGLIIVGALVFTIASIVRSKHTTELPEEQNENTKMPYEIQPYNQPSTKNSVETNYDNQRVTPSGDVVLVNW